MSSLFEVPAQLALVLTLAASGPGDGIRAAPPPVETAAIAPTQVLLDFRQLEGPYRFSESNWLRALREDLPAEAALPVYSGAYLQDEQWAVLRAGGGGAPSDPRRACKCGSRGSRRASVRRRQCLTPADCPASAGDGGRPHIAHVFGPEAAIAFIRQAEATPNDPAARQAPDLVPSEPESESGTPPLTLAQLYNRVTDPLRKFSRCAAAQAALRAREQAAALDLKPTIAEVAPPAPEPLAWRAEISPGGAILPQ